MLLALEGGGEASILLIVSFVSICGVVELLMGVEFTMTGALKLGVSQMLGSIIGVESLKTAEIFGVTGLNSVK